MTQITFCYTPITSLKIAEKLAEEAVKTHHAACVNIVPGALSIYEWEGKIEKSVECLMIFKTTTERLDGLREWLAEKHPYDVPALLSGQVEVNPGFHSFVQNHCANKKD